MKKPIKIILIIIGIIFAMPFLAALLFTAGLTFEGISSTVLRQGQDAKALSYLKEKYGQEFTVLRSNGGNELGGPVTFSKRIALSADPSLEFDVTKCLSRCDFNRSKEFSDSYPYAVWSKQETEALRSDPAAYGIPLGSTVSASLYGSPLSKEDRWVLADTNTGVIPFRELPPEPRRAGYTINITLGERNPNPTEEDFKRFAEILVGIRNKMSEKVYPINGFTATIAPREPLDDSGWRFYTYSYRTSPYLKRDTLTAEEIAAQFKRNEFTDNELYKQKNGSL